MRRRLMATAILATTVLGGCIASYEAPEVRFEGIRLGGLGLRGGTVYAQLNVVNPNRFRLRTDELSYDLELSGAGEDREWVRLAEGTFRDRIEVAAYDSALVEIPIEFAYADLGGALRSILDRGTVDYRVTGRVQLIDPIDRSIPYRRTGQVTFNDMD
jgi:LEA14-like dessication related protein